MRLEQWWITMPLRLRSILRRRQLEQELDEELQFHLLHKTEEGIVKGLSPEEARVAALRAMSGLEQHKEAMRDARGVRWLTDLFDDTVYAIRSLHRTLSLSVFVVITLALGIGMSAATYSMVDALIFRPYPVPDPDHVVSLVSTSHDNAFDNFSYREYLDIRRATTSYDGVIANSTIQGVGFSAEPGATPRVKAGMLVSSNYFRVLGVEPQLGRGFRDDEGEVPGRDAVVVLGADFWNHELGSDPSIVARTVRLNGRDFTVVGIAPASFPGLLIFYRPDFYVPLSMAPVFSTNAQKDFFEDRDDRELNVKARLKADTSLQQARSEIAVLAHDFTHQYPPVSRDRGATVHTRLEMRMRDDDNHWKFMVIFEILGLAVLLVACTNVAGLLLSRARTRTREMAIRLALGAWRFRLIRMLLTESLVLACRGGGAGVAVAYAGIRFLHTLSLPTELPTTIPFELDTRVLLATLGFSAFSALACGLAPAVQSTRTDVVHGLKSAEVDESGRKRLWGRSALVVAQVAFSLVLLTASFLMVRGFHAGVVQSAGFAKDHLLMARLDPRLVQYDADQTQRFYKLLTDRMRGAPGVESAGLTQNPPLGLDEFDHIAFVPDGFDMPRDRENFTAAMDAIDEGFFQTMGVAIVRGHGFMVSDTADSPAVAVVNEQFAKHYWPGGDPIGKRIRLGSRSGASVEIVGVAQTIKYRQTTERTTDFVYLPLNQHPTARMVLLLRSLDDPHQLIDPLKDTVRTLDANMPISEMRTYEELYRYNAVEGPQIAIDLVGVMGAVGLVLAVAGLYGLIAYSVSRRTHEIGIRMALGAAPTEILRLVMGNGLRLVATGTAIGLALGLALERLMNSMLFNAGGVDPLAYVVVVPSLLFVTMLATYAPARRASRIPPRDALRYE